MGIGALASLLAFFGTATAPRLAASWARIAFLLTGPRTGVRSTNTQPTCGTGLPPIRRPWVKSHGYSAWNSW